MASADARRVQSGRGLLTGCGVLLAIVIVLVVVAAIVIGRNIANPGRRLPSPGPYARSAAVRRADVLARSYQDRQFARLPKGLAWLVPAGRSILDTCSVGGGVTSLFGGGGEAQEICDRTDTRYYVFGGSASARVGQLKHVLRQLGWGQFLLQANDPPSGTPPSGTAPEVTAQPETGSALADDTATSMQLQYSWLVQGRLIDVGRELGAVGQRIAQHRNTYLELTAANQKQLVAELTPARRHILIVSIDVTYATKVVNQG